MQTQTPTVHARRSLWSCLKVRHYAVIGWTVKGFYEKRDRDQALTAAGWTDQQQPAGTRPVSLDEALDLIAPAGVGELAREIELGRAVFPEGMLAEILRKK